MNTFLLTFIGLSIVNVVFATIKTITTVKAKKTVASLVSGGYFAYYNIVIIWTVADFPLWQKCLITFVCNVIGVWVVKFLEEKTTKEKMWKIEATITKDKKSIEAVKTLKSFEIPYNYIDLNKYIVINCFCSTRKQSTTAMEVLKAYDAKFFASESKITIG